jgi:hypothetical protein
MVKALGESATQANTDRGFMVLSCYQLAPIPDWARPGMQASLTEAVFWQIYKQNPVLWRLGPWGAYALLVKYDLPDGPQGEIANEMMSRPWPYEKTPPDLPVPPTRGMNTQDRLRYFTHVQFSLNHETKGLSLLLPSIFGGNVPIFTYAQGEAFNWMEYHDSYGSYFTEKFDEISLNTFNSLLACPRAWRLSTPGGMNWRARLSIADGAPTSAGDDDDAQEALQVGSFTMDETTFPTINMH